MGSGPHPSFSFDGPRTESQGLHGFFANSENALGKNPSAISVPSALLVTVLVVLVTTRFLTSGLFWRSKSHRNAQCATLSSSSLGRGQNRKSDGRVEGSDLPEDGRDGERAFRTPLLIPYWVPYYGHLVTILTNADWLFSSLVSKSSSIYEKAFTLVLSGRKHTILADLDCVRKVCEHLRNSENEEALDTSPPHPLDDVASTSWVRQHGFGMPVPERGRWAELDSMMRKLYKASLGDPKSGLTSISASEAELVHRLEQHIKRTISDFVTFNDSPVDQMDWEREMPMEVHSLQGAPDGPPSSYVNADLLRLLQNYVLAALSETVLGCAGPNRYESFQQDVRTLVAGSDILGARVSRGVPISRGTKAYIARRNLMNAFVDYHRTLEKNLKGESEEARNTEDEMWRDVDDTSRLVLDIRRLCLEGRNEVDDKEGREAGSRAPFFKSNSDAVRAAAAETLFLFTSLYARLSGLAYWAIVLIQADPSLLDRARQELGQADSGIRVKYSPPVGLYSQPPRIELDVRKLVTGPLAEREDGVRSWIEKIRHKRGREWVCLRAREDLQVPIAGLGEVGEGKEGDDCGDGWLIQRGNWLAIPGFDIADAVSKEGQTWTLAKEYSSPLCATTGGVGRGGKDKWPLHRSLPFLSPASTSRFSEHAVVALVVSFLALWDVGAPRAKKREGGEDGCGSQSGCEGGNCGETVEAVQTDSPSQDSGFLPVSGPPTGWSTCTDFLVAMPSAAFGRTQASIRSRDLQAEAGKEGRGVVYDG